MMYSVMGIGAVALTTCAAVVGWWVLKAKDFAYGRAVQLGLGWGLILGFVLGTISGGYTSGQQGHWVGGTLSDAGGLPIVKWSRDGGDLRAAHFFGLHAMQILPTVAFVLQRYCRASAAITGIIGFFVAYSFLVTTVFVQALAGRPLI